MTGSLAQWRRGAAAVLTQWARTPWRLAAASLLIHIALMLPILARHDFDASYFIVAGDRYVDAAQTPAPVAIRPHSDGYDGQFYYRLALAPFSTAPRAGGVAFDHPAWRMQRILLPLMVRLVSLGQAALVPLAFITVNLAAIFAIAWLAATLAAPATASAAPRWLVPVAVAFWPGWQIALQHDTTEITAAAFLLAAMAAYGRGRMATYAGLLALASLTRETAILAGAGIAAIEAWRALRAPRPRPWGRVIWATLALLPFLAWRQLVAQWWHSAAQAHGVAHNAGWPLLGWWQAGVAHVINRGFGAARAPHGALMRVTMLAGMAMAVAVALAALPAAARAVKNPKQAGPALAWLLVLALMAVLTANGPLIDATAFFRALSEFWVLAWIVLAADSKQPPPRILALIPWLLLVCCAGTVRFK